MSERKLYVGIIFLIPLLSISLLAALMAPPIFSQENENAALSVSPGAFTASNVPPTGKPYTIPQKITVRNYDNSQRVVTITTEIPSAADVTPGYEPIPNENWIIPIPSSVLIQENSFAVIQLSFDIPRWENLTNQKWEVLIGAERQPLPGEIGVLKPTVILMIETTKELPPPPGGVNLALLAVLIVIVVAAICIGVWYRSRRTGGRKIGKVRSFQKPGMR